MSSYFDEHDCEPLSDNPNAGGANNNELLELARFLVLTGNWDNDEFAGLFRDQPPPPTSKEFIEQLPTRMVREEEEQSCPICLKKFDQDDELNALPCKHEFHAECLVPWLQKTASCPMCRLDLPTGNKEWEEMRRQKRREETRKLELEQLHSNMFG
jgi:E3 ubiquitin-protein ligase RNF181